MEQLYDQYQSTHGKSIKDMDHAKSNLEVKVVEKDGETKEELVDNNVKEEMDVKKESGDKD